MDLVTVKAGIAPELHGLLAMVLLVFGFLSSAAFAMYLGSRSKSSPRNLFVELFIAVVSSVGLGFGTHFMLLWAGLFV